MRFNSIIFFDNYRARIGKLTQTQVNGLNFLLGAVAADERTTMVREFAYMLATVKGETSIYQPVIERRANPLRNPRLYVTQNKYWSTGYYGRGFVQLTWEVNYSGMGVWLNGRTFTKLNGESITIQPDTFTKNPDAVLAPGAAYWIMSEGMHAGRFTGKKLGHYIKEGQPPDYLNARRIINGTDKAAQFANDAQLFELCLRASLIKQ